MVLAMREEGIPADISDAPGTLMCNHMMYGVLHAIAERELPVRAGWVHLPALPSVAAREENLGEPSMTIETSATGLRAAIAAVLSHPKDVDAPVRSRLQI
jgi:pyroglutamyl-peptidase